MYNLLFLLFISEHCFQLLSVIPVIMPALEIMPHCPTMEEAQRRATASMATGRRSPSRSGANHKPSLPPLEHAHNDRKERTTHTTSLSPRQKLTQFVQRAVHRTGGSGGSRRRRRRSSYPSSQREEESSSRGRRRRHGEVHELFSLTAAPSPPIPPLALQEIDDPEISIPSSSSSSRLKEDSSCRWKEDDSASFRSIGMKYFPDILEEEEEEPPEALLFS